MLSILIPVFDYDCSELLSTLFAQLPEYAEMIVADDSPSPTECSRRVREQCQRLHKQCTTYQQVRYVTTPGQCGSAYTRNFLAKEAQYDLLLFLDCDAIVQDASYIQKYLEAYRTSGAQVVCGTLLNPAHLPSPQQSLRYYYEKHCAPQHTVEERRRHPYAQFRTSHFLIERAVLRGIPFDERIAASGYEDTLFGKRLEEKKVCIYHVDIPVINGDLESNEVFLRKTERHMHTLYEQREALASHSTLLCHYAVLKRCRLTGLLAMAFRTLRSLTRRNLLSAHPYIPLFQWYKLGFYTSIARQREQALHIAPTANVH